MNIQQCSVSPVQNSTIHARPIAPPALFNEISDQVELHGHDTEANIDQMLRLQRMSFTSTKPLGDAAIQMQHGAGEAIREACGGIDPGKLVRDCAGGLSQAGTNLVNNLYRNGQKENLKFANGLGQGIDNLGKGAANVLDAVGLHEAADGTRQLGHDVGQGAADVTFGISHLGAQVARGALTSIAEIPKDAAEVVTKPGETLANLGQLAEHPVETVVNHFQQQAKHEGVAYAIGHLLPDLCGGEVFAAGKAAKEAAALADAAKLSREARLLESMKKGAEQLKDYGEQANDLTGNDFQNGRLI